MAAKECLSVGGCGCHKRGFWGCDGGNDDGLDLTHKHRRTIIFFRLNHHLNKPQPLFNSSLGTVLEKLIQHWRFQFIPQFIFLNSLFGYLSLLIIIKWCTGSKADLYHVMIYMFLSPTDDLGENQLFVGQKTTQFTDSTRLMRVFLYQLVLLLLALVAVPWMLLPKPFLLKSQHEKDLIREYPLPEGWYARLPGLEEPAKYGTKFETGIYEEQVKSGYRLHLHPFALRFFEHYRMAPGQLVPNGWRKLDGLIYLVQTSGYKPDATDFMRVFFEICFVKGVANCPGWYYIHSRQRLLKGGPKSNKGWHSKYFFVGRLDKGELLFDRNWNPFCKDFENLGKPTPNNLTKHILSHIKLRGSLSIDEPLSEEQLEWAKIISPKPIPVGLSIPHPPPAIPSMSSAETKWLAEVENRHKEAFLAFSRRPRGSEKRSSQVRSFPLLLKRVESLLQNVHHGSWIKCPLMMIPSFDRDGHLSVMTLGCRIVRSRSSIFFMEFFLGEEAVASKKEGSRRGDQGIRDFLDGNAGDEWLKKQTEDGLEIYELGFAKAKEMFAERFPDIPLDDFVLPAVVSPSGETAMPSEARDAVASHLLGEGPSGDAPEA
ncbi:hypothetical protein RJ640_019388 [Escallonia rubra]|uniref:V-type proton ATPase subunit a n=1 Tax=Escallonia rubra TaxID=112253 RepID=A0AA88QZZ9_9ASTE|nr:hypothetical protein RJ640_019388 [Escallonia rubra]